MTDALLLLLHWVVLCLAMPVLFVLCVFVVGMPVWVAIAIDELLINPEERDGVKP